METLLFWLIIKDKVVLEENVSHNPNLKVQQEIRQAYIVNWQYQIISTHPADSTNSVKIK